VTEPDAELAAIDEALWPDPHPLLDLPERIAALRDTWRPPLIVRLCALLDRLLALLWGYS
jgi:hypothetical protein